MRKIVIAIALLFSLPAFAQTTLPQFPFPGPALGNADGGRLNAMVNAINNIQGNGTPTAGSFTTLTSTGNVSIANGKLTTLASTGATGITGATTITTSSALGLAVGRLGATTPALRVDASASTSITGFRITAAAAGGGLALAATGETNINTTLDAAGSGTLVLQGTATGAITLTRATTLSSTTHAVGVATFDAIPIFPATGVTLGSTTFSEATLALYAKGVAAGYKIARGETALDGSNPTPVTTGLATIVSCNTSIKATAAPGVSTSVVTYDTSSGTMNMYGWKPTSSADTTLIASAGTDTIGWICVGT